MIKQRQLSGPFLNGVTLLNTPVSVTRRCEDCCWRWRRKTAHDAMRDWFHCAAVPSRVPSPTSRRRTDDEIQTQLSTGTTVARGCSSGSLRTTVQNTHRARILSTTLHYVQLLIPIFFTSYQEPAVKSGQRTFSVYTLLVRRRNESLTNGRIRNKRLLN